MSKIKELRFLEPLIYGKADTPIILPELHIYPDNAINQPLKWSVKDPSILTVNGKVGMGFCHKKGNTTVEVYAADDRSIGASFDVNVKQSTFVKRIIINPSELTLAIGCSHTLKTTLKYEDGVLEEEKNPIIEWYSDDPDVASVDSFLGTVYAKKPGIVNICAVSNDFGDAVANCRVECVESYAHKGYDDLPVTDKGVNKTEEYTAADPVDIFSGAHLLENTLMQFFDGQNISLKIQYDSSKLTEGIFGKVWNCDFEKRIVPPEDINNASEILVYSSPSVYTVYKNNYTTDYRCDTPNKRGWYLRVCDDVAMYNLCCGYERNEYYDAQGRLVKIVNREGFATDISYQNNLIIITDTLTNKKIYLEKDSTGKVARVYDNNSREVILTYTNGIISNIEDCNHNNLSFTYNENGQVLTGTDGKGVCYFSNEYDSLGRVIAQKDAIGDDIETVFEYDDENHTRIVTDRNGKKKIQVYNENGVMLSSTDENNITKTFVYDQYNNLIEEKDYNGDTIKKEYNVFGKPTKITDKCGNITIMEYDDLGNLTKKIYPPVNGISAVETFTYGNVGGAYKLLSHTDTRGMVTQYTYDPDTKLTLTKKVGEREPIRYTYQNGNCVKVQDARGREMHYEYNSLGLLTSEIEKGVSYEYDSLGNLLTTTDGLGNMIVNTYDCNNQIATSTDAKRYVTEYSYNGNLKKTSMKLENDISVTYEYDREDRLVKTTDSKGRTTALKYDACGRIIAQMLPDGSTTEYEYDEFGNVKNETNSKGATTQKTYDKNGNVLTITDNDGKVTSFIYDSRNRMVQKTDVYGGVTVYTYSNAGDLLTVTDGLGNVVSYTYDGYGNKLTETDARGNTTTYTYDANNNLTSVTDALDNRTVYTYDNLNRLISVCDAKNHTITYGYDLAGRRTTVTDARGNVFTTYYDGNGNVTKTTDAKGNTINETKYNELNLPISVTDAMGNKNSYIYNSVGEVVMFSNAEKQTKESEYNSRGMNTLVKDFENGNSTAKYDALGNITEITGPMGAVTNYTYDQMGRLTSKSTPSGGTVQYTYNAQSLKESVTNARGQAHQYAYDVLGRIISIIKPEGTTTYTYDANGNVLTVSDANGTITREYDALNRVTRCNSANGYNTWYEYDAVGNVSKITYFDTRQVLYTYDENNNLVTVTDWNGRITSYTYDVNNNLIGINNANGTTTVKTYDNAQRLISTQDRKVDNTIICGYEYTYDKLGQISTEKNLANGKTLCYTYDKLSRVIKCEEKNSSDQIVSTQNFAYDAAGNIISAPTGSFAYDVNNKLTSYNNQTVEYDLDGNMISMPVEDIPSEYTDGIYDSSNRVLRAMHCSYTYDAENNRIRNDAGGYIYDYVYNTNCRLSHVLAMFEYGSSSFYIYGLGLIGEERNGQFYTYHYDYRGSTVAMTDQSGNIVGTAEYDIYGALKTCNVPYLLLFGYNGRDGVQTDSNGLLYMRARYYCPNRRRFINADILDGNISDSTSLNRYAYVNGNPVSLVDPFGLSAERGKSISDFMSNDDLKKLRNIFEYVGYGLDVEKINFEALYNYLKKGVQTAKRPNNIGAGTWQKIIDADLKWLDDVLGSSSHLYKTFDYLNTYLDVASIATDVFIGINENISEEQKIDKIMWDATVDVAISGTNVYLSTTLGAAIGSFVPIPVLGTLLGAAIGAGVGYALDLVSSGGRNWLKSLF